MNNKKRSWASSMMMTYLHAFDSEREWTREFRTRKTGKNFFCSLCVVSELSRRLGSYSILFDMEKQHGSAHMLSFLYSCSARTRRQDYRRKLSSSSLSELVPHRVGAQLKQKKLLTNFVHLLNYTFTFIHPHPGLWQLDTSRYVCTYTLRGGGESEIR